MICAIISLILIAGVGGYFFLPPAQSKPPSNITNILPKKINITTLKKKNIPEGVSLIQIDKKFTIWIYKDKENISFLKKEK